MDIHCFFIIYHFLLIIFSLSFVSEIQLDRRPLATLKSEKDAKAVKVTDMRNQKAEQERLEGLLKTDVKSNERTVETGEVTIGVLSELKIR